MKIIASIIGVIVIVCALVALPIYYVKGTEETVSVVIESKERISDRGGSESKYLIFTNEETFENTDSLLNGKFNSSDIYGQLKEGGSYECKVYGWRIPFMSSYRNIVECKEVK